MSLEIIKADLPNTPDDIINTWLLTYFKKLGWQPKIDNDWRYILGVGRGLEFLQSMQWHKDCIEITPNNLTPKSLGIIIDLFNTHVLRQHTVYSVMMGDGLGRFNRCVAYLKEYGEFPCPVILEQTDNGYRVLDGNHRITAYFYLYGYFKIENDETPCMNVADKQFTWIGKIK